MNDTANTIDAAVEQLIQVPDTSTEDATEEVVEETSEEEVVEPTEQDAESEETLEFDDEELSDIDFDSDDVEEVLEESTEKDSLHTVKINGKEENWTLDQLKQSAAGKVTSTRGCKRLHSLKKLTKSKLLPSPNSNNNNSWSFFKKRNKLVSQSLPHRQRNYLTMIP